MALNIPVNRGPTNDYTTFSTSRVDCSWLNNGMNFSPHEITKLRHKAVLCLVL